MKRVKLETPKDKLDFVIYLIHYILMILFVLVIIGFIGIFIFYLTHGLTNQISQCIISILMCSFLLYSSITQEKFKQIRKKFNNQIFEKKNEVK